MSEENKEIMKMTKQEIEAQNALMEMGAGFSGFEETGQEMLNTPFLKIAQSNSPQIDETNSGYIKDLKPGMFFNTQNGRIYGRELNVIALYAKPSYLHYGDDMGIFKGEYTKGELDEKIKKGEIQKADDGFLMFDAEGGKCSFAITFYVFLPDFPEEGILPFVVKSRGLKHAKTWNSLSVGMTIKIGNETRRAARYQIVWKLKSAKDENEKGTWYNIGNKSGSGIEHVGNILQPEYGKIIIPLKNAVEMMATLKEQRLNYSAAQDLSGDEPIPDDSDLTPQAPKKNVFKD